MYAKCSLCVCAAVVLITANTHSETLQRTSGVIDLSLTHFASHRWNSRILARQHRTIYGQTERVVGVFLQSWRGPWWNAHLCWHFSLWLQTGNKQSSVLQRTLHNGMHHINPSSGMLWITVREAEHIYGVCTCTSTDISSQRHVPQEICVFCSVWRGVFNSECSIKHSHTAAAFQSCTVSAKFHFMGHFQSWHFKSIKIHTGKICKSADLGYAAAQIHFLGPRLSDYANYLCVVHSSKMFLRWKVRNCLLIAPTVQQTTAQKLSSKYEKTGIENAH